MQSEQVLHCLSNVHDVAPMQW